MLTDTGSFCYSGTNAQTFAFAREMVLAGADPAAIAQQVYFSNPPPKCICWAAPSPISNATAPSPGCMSPRTTCSPAAPPEQDCEGLVNWALGIHGIEATAFFREISGSRYRVSLRSKGRIDVARIAQTFGGGGHCCASGHLIAGPLEAAASRVLAALRHALELSGNPQAV